MLGSHWTIIKFLLPLISDEFLTSLTSAIYKPNQCALYNINAADKDAELFVTVMDHVNASYNSADC